LPVETITPSSCGDTSAAEAS